MDREMPPGGGIILGLIACIAGWLLLVVAATGCASPYKLPCEFALKVKVMDTAEVDRECRSLGAADHQGMPVSSSYPIRGCATANGIISEPAVMTLGHEVEHHIKRRCARR